MMSPICFHSSARARHESAPAAPGQNHGVESVGVFLHHEVVNCGAVFRIGPPGLIKISDVLLCRLEMPHPIHFIRISVTGDDIRRVERLNLFNGSDPFLAQFLFPRFKQHLVYISVHHVATVC